MQDVGGVKPMIGGWVPLVIGFAVGGVVIAYGITRALTPAMVELIADWSGPLWLSLRVTGVALIAASFWGIFCGYVLVKGTFRGRDLLEALGSIPLILPPTVIGYLLLKSLDGTAEFHTVVGRFRLGTRVGHRLSRRRMSQDIRPASRPRIPTASAIGKQ